MVYDWRSGQLITDSDHLSYQGVKVFSTATMICYGNMQVALAPDGDNRWDGDPLFLELDHDLFVKLIVRRVVEMRAGKAEVNHIQ